MVSDLVNLVKERQDKQEARLDKLDLCLYGTDGRGGMAADISQIKQDIARATSIIRTFIAPLSIALITMGIGFALGRLGSVV
jgi:hypothetical protein